MKTRRHHNNKGYQAIKQGKTRNFVEYLQKICVVRKQSLCEEIMEEDYPKIVWRYHGFTAEGIEGAFNKASRDKSAKWDDYKDKLEDII